MHRKTFLCLLLVPFLIGCGDGSSDSSNLSQTSVSRQSANLEFVASTTKQRYAVGETIPITFRVTNKSASARQVVFSSGARAAYLITQGSTLIARDTRVYPAALTSVTLQPSEQYTDTFEWNQRDLQGNAVPAGQYTVKSYMPVVSIDGIDYTARTETELYTHPLQVIVATK